MPLLLSPSDPAVLPATREHLLRQGRGEGGKSGPWRSFHPIEFIALNSVPTAPPLCFAVSVSVQTGHSSEEPKPATVFYRVRQTCMTQSGPIGWVLNKGRVPADHTWFGHLIDDVVSNTYRALRFVNDRTYKDLLYAEFTSQPDWHYENPVHYELFNVRAMAMRLLVACC